MADETKNVESVPIHSNDPLLSGEDRLKLTELLKLCTKLSERVLALENTKTSQAKEITKLKKRVKKLEMRNKSRTPGFKRLRKDASKQGRKIADAKVTLVDEAQGRIVDEAQGKINDNLMFNIGVFNEQEIEVEKRSKQLNPKAITTTATTTTTAVTRPKARGVVIQEPSKFRTTTSSLQTSQLPQAKDKGKGKMVEPEKPLKKKDS
ncbi:hypothetical protein Tco_0630831 [Tanacetum coccineum]